MYRDIINGNQWLIHLVLIHVSSLHLLPLGSKSWTVHSTSHRRTQTFAPVHDRKGSSGWAVHFNGTNQLDHVPHNLNVEGLVHQRPCEVRCLGTQNPLPNHLQKGLEHTGHLDTFGWEIFHISKGTFRSRNKINIEGCSLIPEQVLIELELSTLIHGSWFMVHRRPLTTHWACKGQVGCAIPLVAPAGRCNAQMNRNKNKYKSNRKLKWNRPPATAAATLLGFPTSVPNIQGKWIG